MRSTLAPVLLLVACTETVVGGRQRDDDTDPPDLVDTVVDTDNPVAVCQFEPNPALPGEKVDLIGENSRDPSDSDIINYRWSLALKPDMSKATLPAGDANLVGFRPDLLGEYVATLVVTDAWGNPSNPCAATLEVAPEESLYIQVKSSVDDQIRPILIKGDSAWPSDEACRPGDCNVTWGGGDATPVATEALGKPSTIAVKTPGDDVYTLRVVDELDLPNEWVSDTTVDVRIWVNGREKWSTKLTLGGAAKNVEVATILWPAGTVKAVPQP